jgi:integrase
MRPKNMPKRKMPKDSMQKGCLQRHGKMWRVFLRENYSRPDGTVGRKLVPHPVGRIDEISEEEAGQKMAQLVVEINQRTTPPTNVTVQEFYSGCFQREHVAKKKHAGRETYRWTFGPHIIPAIGDMKVREVNLGHVQQLCDLKLAEGKSTSLVDHIRCGLSAMFRRAIAHRIITYNPATGIILPEMTHGERRSPALEDVRALLIILRDPAYFPTWELTMLACCDSLNFAEMAGLLWPRVSLTDQIVLADGQNLPGHSVAIRQNFYRKEFGTTKSPARNRILPLPMALVEALTAVRTRSQFSAPDDLVFCEAKGVAISYDVMLRKLKKAGKQVGIPWIGWHDLRRYFANASDRLGMPEEDREYMMGHSSAAMTRRYTTVPDIERKRPYVELIARELLAPDVTTAVTR